MSNCRGYGTSFTAGLGVMPDASLLPGLQEFIPQQSKEHKTAGTVAELLNQFDRSSNIPAQPSSTMATGEGLPALPRKWVERIQVGDYMDFTELPPAGGRARGLPKTLDGQILVVQAADLMETRQAIPDLAT